MTEILFIIRIVLSAVMLLCSIAVIFIVIFQSANSDGMQAMTGSSTDRDSLEYARNSAGRKERRLKILTYILAGVVAVISVVFLILESVI